MLQQCSVLQPQHKGISRSPPGHGVGFVKFVCVATTKAHQARLHVVSGWHWTFAAQSGLLFGALSQSKDVEQADKEDHHIQIHLHRADLLNGPDTEGHIAISPSYRDMGAARHMLRLGEDSRVRKIFAPRGLFTQQSKGILTLVCHCLDNSSYVWQIT